jgi:hypothetical protein
LQFEVGEVASIILASVILTLLVDLPFQEAKKVLWQKGKYLRSAVYVEYVRVFSAASIWHVHLVL